MSISSFSSILAIRCVQIAEAQQNCSSSILCAQDARSLYNKGFYEAAYKRAKRSLSYSVGIFNDIYQNI